MRFQSFEFPEPGVVTGEAVYTIEFTTNMQNVGWVSLNNENPYAGGRASVGEDVDFLFRTFIKPCEK